jgi:hypothetical protein
MTNNQELDNSDEIPIFGLEINDGVNAPFADLYLDMFPEYYDVE